MQSQHNSVQLVFDSFYHFYKNDSDHLTPLYSYGSTKIKVILFYGSDLKRVIGPPGLLDIVTITKHWFLFVWFALSIFTLHLIRSTTSRGRITVYSSTWSMFIVWIGGGNLRCTHGIERFFLTIMFFGVFFVKAFGVGNFNTNIVLQGANGVDTFLELAKLSKRPIYLNHVFHDKKDIVLKLLGSVYGMFN